MAEATNTTTTISRRSTRFFIGEQDAMEAGIAGQTEREPRHGSEEQERPQKAQKPQRNVPSTTSTEGPIIPLVDFGKDLCGMFPTTVEDIDDHGTLLMQCRSSFAAVHLLIPAPVVKSLQAVKKDKFRGEGRPINFGIVLPGAVYRSSFPMTEDFHFLGRLGLRTVV